ncbi:zinc transporter [Desulfatibacillum alkenivorans DSM 16219]|uniref:Zinc transporter n=2 Tax=Desulfatibacillum alkenivorans TaxID=259354 RepID=A0A1M6YQE5_9BACT|nr:zinc transporter [Desulfatibacillum alkenivorans DSM 16219]
MSRGGWMQDSSGLIYAYLLDGVGGGRSVGWEDILQWTPDQGILWLHVDFRDPYAMAWLDEKSGLNPIVVQGLIADETRPRSVGLGEDLLVILRGINANPGSDPEDMVALRMLLEPGRIISMRHRRVMAVQDAATALEEGVGPKDSGEFFTFVCSRITDRMGDVIYEIDDLADQMEEAVLEPDARGLRPQVSKIRRQAIALRRYIAPQRDVLLRLQNEKSPILNEFHKMEIREDAERTARFVEDMDAARDRAAVTQEELGNRLAEEMNRAMLILSVVAAIFLPLGLLTGLLGINVGGIPGADYRWAFLIVCVFLLGLGGVLLFLFKRMRWL